MRNEGVSALLNLILPLGQPGSCCKSVLQEWSGMKESESRETPWLQEKALTCTLRGDHFGFAASTISLHGVGGHGDGIGSLGLEPSNDHFLFARCQREIVSVLRPTPKGSSLLPAGVSALFQHAGTPNPRARDTLGLLWEMAEGESPVSLARHSQLCKHSPALQGPVQGILLQICLSHIPCLHTNHFSIQMLSLPSKLSSPLYGLRGGSEVSGRLHFFYHYPSLLSSEIFLMPS